jgi:hypothetical protein
VNTVSGCRLSSYDAMYSGGWSSRFGVPHLSHSTPKTEVILYFTHFHPHEINLVSQHSWEVSHTSVLHID